MAVAVGVDVRVAVAVGVAVRVAVGVLVGVLPVKLMARFPPLVVWYEPIWMR